MFDIIHTSHILVLQNRPVQATLETDLTELCLCECPKEDRKMDFLGWIKFLWKLLQPAAVLAMAFVLFLWHQNYREANNAVLELKEERLKEK